LAEAVVGVPLGAAANLLSSSRSRGRHGNALQWHFGLDPHDGRAVLDWEDRIEIKLVSVWARGDGGVACDKLKVSDLAIDPWHKLANVLWVFADRLTRVVVGAALSRLAGATRERLAASWGVDPHFEHPLLFVEAREQEGKRAPAYYLAARWFEEERLLPASSSGIFPFDAAWWNASRAEHGRDPWLTLVDGTTDRIACPRCRGALSFDRDRVAAQGLSPARHGMPAGDTCLLRGHVAIDGRRLGVSPWQSPEEFRAALESRLSPAMLWRLADRVPEPDDHEHPPTA
jgi:hypothetical protein